MLTEDWSLGCPADAAPPFHKALRDFQDYLFESMGLSLRLVHADAPYVLWLAGDSSIETGFVLEADPRHGLPFPRGIRLSAGRCIWRI